MTLALTVFLQKITMNALLVLMTFWFRLIKYEILLRSLHEIIFYIKAMNDAFRYNNNFTDF